MANFENLENLATIGTVQDLAVTVKNEIDETAAKIPTKISALTNDSNYATTSAVDTAIASQIGRVYRAGGSKAFADLPEASAETLGCVYNVTDDFTTTDNFVEGAGKKYAAGTDVGVVEDGETYKYNVFANFVDTSNLVEKDGAKTLSDNNYSDTEKAKLDGIATGATKVEESTIDGNVKINGVETPVVNIATREQGKAVIDAIFGGVSE